MSESIEDALMRIFPRFYYGAPVMPKHPISAEAGESPCSEYGDAIIWIIWLLSCDTQDACERGEIEDIFARKYDNKTPSTSFRTRIKTLWDAKAVEMIDDTEDERKWRVQLTDKGDDKLEHIKQQRLKLLAPIITFLKKSPPDECELVLKYLQEISNLFWEYAKVESFNRARNMQLQKRRKGRKVVSP
jgi:DNA-binding MarR family transcriptional regulator